MSQFIMAAEDISRIQQGKGHRQQGDVLFDTNIIDLIVTVLDTVVGEIKVCGLSAQDIADLIKDIANKDRQVVVSAVRSEVNWLYWWWWNDWYQSLVDAIIEYAKTLGVDAILGFLREWEVRHAI